MIKDGKPYTDENGWVDDKLITDLTLGEQQMVLDWIDENLEERKSPNRNYSSYSLKHRLENDLGIYLTNNQFKDAMLEAGFEPINPNALNWYFCINII